MARQTVPSGLSGVTAIAAGWAFGLARESNGTVVGWGSNGDEQTTIPAGLSGVIRIAAGGYHSLAVTTAAPGTVSALALSGLPSPYPGSTAHSLTVTAKNASGNTDPSYRGKVHFTSTDPKAVLPADYTFTSADAGVHVFSLTLKTYGTQSVTATDTVTSSIKGSQTGIVVNYAAASFYATSPRRILDTRATVKSGNPTNIGLSGTFKAGTVRRFTVAGAKYVGGGTALAVPANAVAVTGNLTVVNETAAGVIDLGPAASASGTTSTLSFVKGDTRANNVTVGLAADGTLAAVYRIRTAGATTNLIFDVTGYFLPGTSGATYHTLTPGRILDTRKTGGGVTHIGPLSKLANRVVETFPVAGVIPVGGSSALVPSTAVAVTGNITVTNATSLGYVALGPTMTTSPSTSTVNVAKGTNVANGVTVALSAASCRSSGAALPARSADVIFDVTGYFTSGAGGLSFYGLTPVRLLDTSKNLGLTGPFASRTARLFTVGGTSTDPIDCQGHSRQPDLASSHRQRLGPGISPEIVARLPPPRPSTPPRATVRPTASTSLSGHRVTSPWSGPALPAPPRISPWTSPATGSRGRGRGGGGAAWRLLAAEPWLRSKRMIDAAGPEKIVTIARIRTERPTEKRRPEWAGSCIRCPCHSTVSSRRRAVRSTGGWSTRSCTRSSTTRHAR